MRRSDRFVLFFLLASAFLGPQAAPAQEQKSEPFVIPVLVVKFFPADEDGVFYVSGRWGGIVTLDAVREKTERVTKGIIEALEEGSRYNGYKDPAAQPCLKYEIVGELEFLEPLPLYTAKNGKLRVVKRQVMDKIGIEDWVEKGVKEVWIWGYDGGEIELCESNMAGPFGDISNSDRDPGDLPVFDTTYTVYEYNLMRDVSEGVEDHVHQIEALFRDLDKGLFWKRFVGFFPGGNQITAGNDVESVRRCGWAHFPPNGQKDYDWTNRDFVQTDMDDWHPDAPGTLQKMNCERWHCYSLDWFIYWMQHLPGKGTTLTYQGRRLKNWWKFIGDFDNAMREGQRLYY